MNLRFDRWLALRAIVFALIVNWGSINLVINGHLNSRLLISDADETVYLKRAYDISQGRSPDSIFYEYDRSPGVGEIIANEPHALIDLLGALGLKLGITPIIFGFFLDLFCAALSFYIFVLIFRLLARDLISAEIGAFFSLVLPWKLSIDQYLNFHLQKIFPHLINAPVGYTACLPILRGFYTQLSYPVYGLAIYFALKTCLDLVDRKSNLIFAAIATGLLIYLYFFSWLAVSLVCFSMICITLCRDWRAGITSLQNVTRLLGTFIFAHLCTASFGLYVLLAGHGARRDWKFIELKQYWYFSSEVMICALLAIFLAFVFRRQRLLTTTFMLFATIYVSQLLLMNTQPLLGKVLSPFRFVQLYLQPLNSGLIASLVCSLLFSRIRFSNYLVGIYLFFAFSAGNYALSREMLDSAIADSQFEELISELNANYKRSDVFAVLSFSKPYTDRVPKYFSWDELPNQLHLFTGAHSLHQFWIVSSNMTGADLIRRELLAGWIFSGKPQLFWPCISRKYIPLPGDIFSVTWTIHKFYRSQICLEGYTDVMRPDLCSLLKAYKLDYLVWDRTKDELVPTARQHLQKISRLVWTSSKQQFEVYQFNQAQQLELACQSSSPASPSIAQ